MKRIVVVGASLAGHHAAVTLRRLGHEGAVTVIGSEPHRPYDRYPLSKAFLSGETDRHGLDVPSDVPDVAWHLGSTATSADLEAGHVVVDHQERIPFDGLVVASGARPRHAAMVQMYDGAFVLRTVEDGIALRAALMTPGRRVVVVGGGLIGAEIAAAAAPHHDTTWVHSSDVPTVNALGRSVAEHVRGLHEAAGVRLLPNTRVGELGCSTGAVTGVVLEDGRRLPADVVVMATGTEANVGWLRGSGLETSGGLHCRPTLFAVHSERVVGAGDVVRAPVALLDGEAVRVEHWASTRAQAALAVENLLVGPHRARALTALPKFGTKIHGSQLRGIGYPQVADRGRVIWGSLREGSAVVALARGGTAVALIAVNADEVVYELARQMWPPVLTSSLTTTR
jgi:3-phenylpropionate/trans-cinnamate dioxygenase ferredoxin reductase component